MNIFRKLCALFRDTQCESRLQSGISRRQWAVDSCTATVHPGHRQWQDSQHHAADFQWQCVEKTATNVRKCYSANVTTYELRVRPICKYTMNEGLPLQLYCDKNYSFTLPVIKTQALLECKLFLLCWLDKVQDEPVLVTRNQ